MLTRIMIPLNMLLLNAGFILSFLIRYGFPLPKWNFRAYENSFMFITFIFAASWIFAGVYKNRFRSSWDLFRRILIGLCAGTLLSVAFVYIFREKWGAFPTSVFAISFFINLLLVFRFNQFVMKSCGRIIKRILVIGSGNIDDFLIGKGKIEKILVDKIDELHNYSDIDEIVICGQIPNEKDMGFITFLAQKLNIEVVFGPVCYAKLLSERISGSGIAHPLSTIVGRKRETEEVLIWLFDRVAAFFGILLMLPVLMVVAAAVKITSSGPVLYKQQRIGKDGKLFNLYKFRTMIKDAEKMTGPVLAKKRDPRLTPIGLFLRVYRIDELPQLWNVLRGDMSLVGPRPERPFFVERHRILQGIRLAVKPGLTGLAQIRSYYDLEPRHKIKYDFLYIQRRSLLLNLYILLNTVNALISKKGW